ncbi:hypothetical protein IGI04_030228 [Brassica rapa subsp. trilocularis]|uniref:Uncharacterized protein n=1 Tax=Brassica rapa subsp. trilocularis TaxID=1813537 RepID=A0ABQ7LQ54_BRACM|nr:hypothetical protein IGI04_030228 [Brassica rapa subsp. trilocularis]
MDRDPWPREREGEPLETFEHYAVPHATVKDIKCTHREVKETWDDYESLFYNNNEWLKVTISPTQPADDLWPNLGAVFYEHLVKLEMKPIGGRGRKKETVGSLLTPIFMHIVIPLDHV